MTRTARYIATRVLIGLLIGVGMFYFRAAHAQTPATECTPAANQSPSPWTAWPSPPAGQVAKYRPGSVGAFYSTPEAAASAWATSNGYTRWSQFMSGSQRHVHGRTAACGATGQTQVINQTFEACPAGQTVVNGQCQAQCPAGQHYQGTQCIADSCPAAGTKDTVIISGTPPGDYCLTVPNGTNCAVTVVIGMTIVGNGGASTWNERMYTGATCTTPQNVAAQPTSPITTVAGIFTPDASEASGRKGCGFIASNYTCLGEPTANGKCRITPNGGSICVTSLDPTKPAATPPDTGVPGRPATAQGTATTNTGNTSSATATADFFSPAQVNNSTNYSGQPPTVDEGEEGEDGSFISPNSGYDFGDAQSEIDAKRVELADAFAQIRSEAGSIFGGITGGTGSLPRFNATVGGFTLDIDLSRFNDQLNFLGAILLFMSLVSAAFIIMGSRD